MWTRTVGRDQEGRVERPLDGDGHEVASGISEANSGTRSAHTTKEPTLTEKRISHNGGGKFQTTPQT